MGKTKSVEEDWRNLEIIRFKIVSDSEYSDINTGSIGSGGSSQCRSKMCFKPSTTLSACGRRVLVEELRKFQTDDEVLLQDSFRLGILRY